MTSSSRGSQSGDRTAFSSRDEGFGRVTDQGAGVVEVVGFLAGDSHHVDRAFERVGLAAEAPQIAGVDLLTRRATVLDIGLGAV